GPLHRPGPPRHGPGREVRAAPRPGVRSRPGGARRVEVTSSAERFREALEKARARGDLVGFVPTMGDLHQGHALLVRTAREQCGFVAVSVFVNPLQFESREDLDAYPRRLEKDQAMAAALRSDLLFAPG